jgi:hypothetical protein
MSASVRLLRPEHALWRPGPHFALDIPAREPPAYSRRFYESSGYVECSPAFKELLEVHDIQYRAPRTPGEVWMVDLIAPASDSQILTTYRYDPEFCLWRLAHLIEYQKRLYDQMRLDGKEPECDFVNDRATVAYVGGMVAIVSPDDGYSFSLYLDAVLPEEREWQEGTRLILPHRQY